MPTPTPQSQRRDQVEAWWPLIARILAFFFGGYLIYKEQLPPPGVEEYIILTGVGCMGPTVATAVASLIEAARGGGQPPLEPPA